MSNKDEALRAIDIAENCMSKKDFTTARRVAIKAQKMDASLETLVGRIIMVCDVHCATLEKSGDETDWYKILQVEQNADDNTIKKQYKKLALHLHPDKNKLPGAECAFKAIGEAQRVLLDKDSRRLHDMRRKPFRRPAPAPSFQPQQAPATAVYTQPVFQANAAATRKRPEKQKNPQPQPTEFGGGSGFWTTDQAAFPFNQQCKFPTQASKATEKQPENSANISSSKEGAKAKSVGTSAEKINRKRKRNAIIESSDSSCSDRSIECEEIPAGKQYSGSTGGQHSRKSVRSKQQVSYREYKSDDDNKEEDAESAKESDFRKKSHVDHVSAQTLPNGMNRKKLKENQVQSSLNSGASNAAKDLSSESASDAEIFECPDPDFSNFEKSREEKCFKAGQTWAMYDDIDGMPRFYANIRNVIKKPRFMIKIKWLEAKPEDERAKQWIRRKMPISVGTYELGDNTNIYGTLSFSHLIHCIVRGKKDVFGVYPRLGETWALFKNWDINLSSGRHRFSHEYEYEVVEILSEYAEGAAIEVALLRRKKGFVSVFCRTAPDGVSDTFHIQPQELLRFSHNIPSTKLNGTEGNGVPVGSYELDTAALPQKNFEDEKGAVPVSGEASKSNHVHHRSPPSPEPDCIIVPNFQFHNFYSDRIEGKFAIGQIWSLKSKEDGLPKTYAKIQKIAWKPAFQLQINRLELESLPENVTEWRDKEMPVSCGNFFLMEGRNETLTKVTQFSHQIKAQPKLRKNVYTILPRTGEIWAIYKNWSETIKVSSLKKCEYEVVEVLDDDESHIEVMMLERVNEYISVFKEKVEGGIDVKKKIPRSELLRFSHFVPAFRLTSEKNGTLRGYVELDPAVLSRNLRRS